MVTQAQTQTILQILRYLDDSGCQNSGILIEFSFGMAGYSGRKKYANGNVLKDDCFNGNVPAFP